MISQTGSSRGVTLLEVLITLAIIALFSGVFLLSFDDGKSEELLAEAANELKAVALLAKKRSHAFRQDQVLRFEGRRFFLAESMESEAEAMEESAELLAAYALPEEVTMEFLLLDKTRWTPLLEYDWRFRKSGLSDALGVRFSSGGSYTILRFNSLTGLAEEESFLE